MSNSRSSLLSYTHGIKDLEKLALRFCAFLATSLVVDKGSPWDLRTRSIKKTPGCSGTTRRDEFDSLVLFQSLKFKGFMLQFI